MYKICRSFSFNYFLHNFLVSRADCCFRSSISLPLTLSLSPFLRLQTVSVLFSVALHIFGAAHKFGCPSARSALSLGAFVKNHCCYSNFMEIPTLFLAFSFQRTDLRLRKICLSYASLRLILQKTKKPNRKRRGRGRWEWQKKLLLGLLLSYSWPSLWPLRVARSCPAVGVHGEGGVGGGYTRK